MNFNIKFNKLGNKFFFIANLTEWHFSCVKEYNELWIQETGKLSKEEEDALSDFSSLLSAYGFKTRGEITWLGLPFITSQENPWEKIRETVSPEEYEKIEVAFEIFTPRFNKVWPKEKERLKKAKRTLSEIFSSEKERLKKSLDALYFLFGKRLKRNTFNLYLIAIPKESSTIGATNLSKKGMVFEVSSLEKLPSFSRIFLHEISHELIEQMEEIDFNIVEEGDLPLRLKTSGALRELVLCSLLPDGHLAKKYFNFKLVEKDNFWSKVEKCVIKKSSSLAEDYIKNKKKIDQNYLREIMKIVQDCV